MSKNNFFYQKLFEIKVAAWDHGRQLKILKVANFIKNPSGI
jgi:hypothetical protein